MKASVTELPFNNFLGIHPAYETAHYCNCNQPANTSIISAQFTRPRSSRSQKLQTASFCSDIWIR
jgi:hypothetical protein